MTVFDLAVLCILFLSVLLGLWRGMVSEVLALVSWIIAFLVARQFSSLAQPLVAPWTNNAALQTILAMALVFVGVLILFALARLVVSSLLKAIGLGWLDRSLGALFGIARGLLIVLVGVLVAGMTQLPKASWWQEAMLAPPLETAVLALKPWLPEAVAKRINFYR